MGYSLDSGSDTTVVKGTSIDTSVSEGTGAHVLHVKAWGDKGASCVTVTSAATGGSGSSGSSGGSNVPSNASSNSAIQALGNWQEVHDSATPGKASGEMSMTTSPSHSGSARKFVTKFSGSGGERYSVSFGDDESATNFLYDGWVYFKDSADSIENLEMDLNQVLSDGHTVIYAFQCSGNSGKWEYTKNSGSVDHPNVDWVHSSQSCNPKNWSVNTWHHVQISYSRDDSGTVTYKSVWLDDKEQQINATVPSAFALGWGKVLMTNFQVDGHDSGSSTVYLDDLVIYRW
jgi:hypothetical protein